MDCTSEIYHDELAKIRKQKDQYIEQILQGSVGEGLLRKKVMTSNHEMYILVYIFTQSSTHLAHYFSSFFNPFPPQF